MLEDNVEDIKALALYFDEIDIVEQRHVHFVAPLDAKPDKNGHLKVEVVSTNDFTDERFVKHLREFEESKVVRYSIDVDPGGRSPEKGVIPISSDMILNDIMLSNPNLVGTKTDEKTTIDDDGRTIFSFNIQLNKEAEHLSNILFPSEQSMQKLFLYYAKVCRTFLNSFEHQENIITSSKYVNEIFQIISRTDRFRKVQENFKNELNVSPFLAFEAIRLGVPNLGRFPPSEILKFKEQSKPELDEFKSKLESLSLDLLNNYDYSYINQNAQKISDLKIKPLVDNISRSIGHSKIKALQELIKEAKDPKSYSPLLLTLSNNVSNTMAILISLGLITLNTGIEHYSKLNELKKDGVYYLYKMNKYFD